MRWRTCRTPPSKRLPRTPAVRAISLDRPVRGTLERTTAAVGATWVRQNLGFDGAGVTVAIVDSGVADWHDDLGPTRVVRFADFVNFASSAYDDYGHGTHVAGIIAGDGFDSGGRQAGVAPGASLLVEKVLDANGEGYISNVIAAIDYAVANRDALHVRVINLSVAAGRVRVLSHRPAHARGQTRGRRRHRRRIGRGQSRHARGGRRRGTAASAHPATRPG